MKIRINGKEEIVADETMLADLITGRALVPGRVVVEHNLRITPREEWPSILLKENDIIEIVSFMGGGQVWKTYWR